MLKAVKLIFKVGIYIVAGTIVKTQIERFVKNRVDVLSLGDLQDLAEQHGRVIAKNRNTINNKEVYKITGIPGLFNFEQLKNLFLH